MPRTTFPITTVFDNQFFDFPLDENELREIFEDILDSNSFSNDAWTSISNDTSRYLSLDITQNKSGKITNKKQLKMRALEAELFVNSLYELFDHDTLCALAPSTKFTNKTTLEFWGYTSKEQLAAKIKELFPRADKNKIENPQELLNILNAMENGLIVHHDNFSALADIIPGSALHQLVSDSKMADRFNEAAEAWGLNFTIDIDDSYAEISLPVMAILHPETYQERLNEMKTDLNDMLLQTAQSVQEVPPAQSETQTPVETLPEPEEVEPVTEPTPAPMETQPATESLSIGQYQKYVKQNKKFHFFGFDKETPEINVIEEVKSNIKPEIC